MRAEQHAQWQRGSPNCNFKILPRISFCFPVGDTRRPEMQASCPRLRARPQLQEPGCRALTQQHVSREPAARTVPDPKAVAVDSVTQHLGLHKAGLIGRAAAKKILSSVSRSRLGGTASWEGTWPLLSRDPGFTPLLPWQVQTNVRGVSHRRLPAQP